jgi:hypothetical protein
MKIINLVLIFILSAVVTITVFGAETSEDLITKQQCVDKTKDIIEHRSKEVVQAVYQACVSNNRFIVRFPDGGISVIYCAPVKGTEL